MVWKSASTLPKQKEGACPPRKWPGYWASPRRRCCSGLKRVDWLRGGKEGGKTARFPRWQFGQHGQVLAGLEAVLKILNRNQRVDAWGRILFFLQTEGSLGNKRPLDLLREGRVNDVRMAAEAYVG